MIYYIIYWQLKSVYYLELNNSETFKIKMNTRSCRIKDWNPLEWLVISRSPTKHFDWLGLKHTNPQRTQIFFYLTIR
jgi:hypothetical protein